ncbi:type III effector protein [Ralstonia solanacearum]|uniref:type III effector protein n=1 Tax=Ralstonia solanacearum TaxID=305 RepID=UPI001E2C11D2|nr:type III effector protein [Ralstonia solanacearum]
MANLPRASRSSNRLRRGASSGSLQAGPEVKVPQLQELIGEERAKALDVRFGSLRPSASTEAPAEQSASSSSAGIKRPRSPGALADLPQASRLSKRPHRDASLNSLHVGPEVKVPQPQELIGEERAKDLDVRFGSLQPVRTKDGDGIHAWERDEDGRPLVHPSRLVLQDTGGEPPDWTDPDVKKAFDVDALKKNEKRYIWAVSLLGRVFVGEEVPVESSPDSEKQHYQGHPLLVGGGNARICGEFQLDAQSGKLKVINKSGRYSRYEDRNEAHLLEVGAVVRQAVAPLGLEVETEYLSGKTPEALVLPSLDPSRQTGPAD